MCYLCAYCCTAFLGFLTRATAKQKHLSLIWHLMNLINVCYGESTPLYNFMGEAMCKSEFKKKKKWLVQNYYLLNTLYVCQRWLKQLAIFQGLQKHEEAGTEINTLVVCNVFKVGVFNDT